MFVEWHHQPALGGDGNLICALAVSDADTDHCSLRQMFGHWWKVERTATCGEAFKYLRSNQVAVVICEAALPDGDWRAILGALEEKPVAPKLIVTSWLPDPALWAEVLNLGGWDVLAKPFVEEEVVHVVDSALSSWNNAWERARSASQRKSLPRPSGRFSAHRARASAGAPTEVFAA